MQHCGCQETQQQLLKSVTATTMNTDRLNLLPYSA